MSGQEWQVRCRDGGQGITWQPNRWLDNYM